ncbi:MAG: hypothetical protein A3F46_09835 [Legionellales bacterium RIFCSPHIGHO2_12_FULL_42_9]|nr:MAG: hypothetical protein A3F46_09835 [Legionellales bacterium RIFCSPHIGHO2_12_FULL_42_9]
MIKGKVRDIYDEGNTLLIISTNRLSAFDRPICDIPCKGVILNQLAAWWFEATQAIIQNHVIELPQANSMRVKKCRVLPIEVVVRGYITGSTNTSLWTLYQQGARQVFGNQLPEGLQKNQKLPQPILTPTTKSAEHDRPLNLEDITKIPNLTPALWEKIKTTSLALFQFANDTLAQKNLILADTKYEFGLDNNNQLCLIDEIHTPDSSRYWDIASLQQAFAENRDPASYDKEIIRLWYTQHCNPYQIKELPKAPLALIHQVSERYQALFSKITGKNVVCAES